MANINKNIIMQAGAAVANATNKAAGLSASTPEPGSIISAIQLVNGGRTIGPDALAHFTESVRNKLLSLIVNMEPIQSGTGEPSPDNVRPISGRTGLSVYVGPTQDSDGATTYSVDWTSEAGTVYGGTLDVVTGVLTVDKAMVDLGTLTWSYANSIFVATLPSDSYNYASSVNALSDCYAFVGTVQNGTFDMQGKADCSFALYYNTNYPTSRVAYVKNTAYTDAATFKTAMDGHQLVYELATPLTYQLTAQDIITLVGDNYIWSDSGDVIITE